jgi:hypothetical protein
MRESLSLRNRRYDGRGDHVCFEKADERASDGFSGRAAARLSEELMHDEARTCDATLRRGGAAQGTAGADVFGRATAIVRSRVLQHAHDLTERFYSGKTRALHATHLSTG